MSPTTGTFYQTQSNFHFSQHAHFPVSGRSILYLILSPLKCFVQISYLSFHLIFLPIGLCKGLFTWRDCDYNLIITRNEFCYRPQTKLANVMFLHVSVILSTGGGGVPGQVPLGPGTPPWDQIHPRDQVHPETRYTPWTRYTPQTRYTPRTRYTPHQVPPGTRYTPWDQVHPPEQCILGDVGNKWAVCILLECILV